MHLDRTRWQNQSDATSLLYSALLSNSTGWRNQMPCHYCIQHCCPTALGGRIRCHVTATVRLIVHTHTRPGRRRAVQEQDGLPHHDALCLLPVSNAQGVWQRVPILRLDQHGRHLRRGRHLLRHVGQHAEGGAAQGRLLPHHHPLLRLQRHPLQGYFEGSQCQGQR